MLLALDVGNTNTVLGLYRLDVDPRQSFAAHWRVTTHRAQTVDEYGVFFVNLFEMHGMSPKQVTHIIISSVVPPVESTLRQVCETYFHVEPLFVEPGIKTGMPVLSTILPSWARTGWPMRLPHSSAMAARASWSTSARRPSLK